MHRILLHEVVIDVPPDLLAAQRAFWAGALAATPRKLDQYEEFTSLPDATARMPVGLQEIASGAPRYHLDIETDDVEAEVARLIALGATEVARPHTWVVLHDPAGLLLCVLPAESPDFAALARPVG